MSPSETALPLRIGARTIWTVRRHLIRRRLSLDEALAGHPPPLTPIGKEGQGYLVTGLPASLMEALWQRSGGLKCFIRQSYRRSYARLDIGFDAYWSGFSAKSRSTLKRKARKLAEQCGGALDVRAYRSEQEMLVFHQHARSISALSYQERLLDAGIPGGTEAVSAMLELARSDQVRGWILFVHGRPASYLYAPAEGETLIYAHLGYDPEFAAFSPGTVLQLEAMRDLMTERRFALFDFTEGEGQHKRLFATGSVDCVDLLLLRPGIANLATGYLLNGFDRTIAIAKSALGRIGSQRLARKWIR